MNFFLKALLLIIALVILFHTFFYSAEILLSPSMNQGILGSVCIKPFGKAQGEETCFDVELAKTTVQIERGLMYRKELDRNMGMLFIFEKEDIYPFWMKNTLIPLDIIWIDVNGKVVYISQNAEPCKDLTCPLITPSGKAKYVLEINGGISKEFGLTVGDAVVLDAGEQ